MSKNTGGFAPPPLKNERKADGFVSGAKERNATPEKLVRITIDLTPDQHKRLKIGAINDGSTISKLFREWVDSKYGHQ